MSEEFDLATQLFHRINRIIPRNQKLLTVEPTCLARDAVAQMRTHGYSQVPVIQEGVVLGVFSYRSFAKKAAEATLEKLNRQHCAPGELAVDEFLEDFQFARVTEEMSAVFNAMDNDNGILIGTDEKLIGILAPMDLLRYLYKVASPFVMVSEIELALRAVIQFALRDASIEGAAKRSLASLYGGESKVPATLEEMTFDNYRLLISHKDNWVRFATILGGTRALTSGKLAEIGVIRNDLFHFKRDSTLQDHQTLTDHRNWLLNKIKQVRGLGAGMVHQ
jgi:predicted transcriptional regulator